MKGLSVLFYMLVGFALSIGIYLAAFGFPRSERTQRAAKQIEEAEKAYSSGEHATTLAARKQEFNRALTLYSQLEETFHPSFGNGRLYYNIANTYYQLSEYPLAIYYYERALALDPRNEEILNNLALTRSKLGIKGSEEEPILHRIFFFHYFWSLPKRLALFLICGLSTLLFLSLFIWFRWKWFPLFIALAGIAALLLLSSVIYSHYLGAVEGVLVKAASLYRDAGEQYAKVSEKPLNPGLKVEILDVRQKGEWLKILTPDGTLGYVKQDSIKII